VHFVVGFEGGLSTTCLSCLHVRFMMNGVALERASFCFILLLSIPPLANNADLILCYSTDQAVQFRIFGPYVGASSLHRKFSGENYGS